MRLMCLNLSLVLNDGCSFSLPIVFTNFLESLDQRANQLTTVKASTMTDSLRHLKILFNYCEVGKLTVEAIGNRL